MHKYKKIQFKFKSFFSKPAKFSFCYTFIRKSSDQLFYSEVNTEWLSELKNTISKISRVASFEVLQEELTQSVCFDLDPEKVGSYFSNFYIDGHLKKLIANLMRHNKKNGLSIIFRGGYAKSGPLFEKISVANYSNSGRFFDNTSHHLKTVPYLCEMIRIDGWVCLSTSFTNDYKLKNTQFFFKKESSFLENFYRINQKYGDVLEQANRWNQENKIVQDKVIETSADLNHNTQSIINSLNGRGFNLVDPKLNLPFLTSV